MFKSLRDKLKGVSKKLEGEVEKSLEDQLERELAEAVAKARPSPTVPAQPPVSPAPAAPPASAAAPAPSPAAPPVPNPAAPSPPAPAQPAPFVPAPNTPPQPTVAPRVEPPAQPTFTPQPPVAPEPTSPSASPPSAPAPAGPLPPAPAPVSPATVPAQAPAVERQPAPFVPARPETAQPTEAARVAPPPQPAFTPAPPMPAPAPVPAAAPAAHVAPPVPAPAPVGKGAATAERTGGRKMLSEAEIAERLERELMEAVEVQKAVEQVVATEAPAARFTINEQVLEDILWDLEVGLLESDVALPVIEAIKANVKEQLLSLAVGGKRPEEIVEKVLRTAIKRVLQVSPIDFDRFIADKMAAGKKPVVVMFVGVNGTGKTTSIGRIAWRLKQKGIGVVMAAGDTFRAGAIEQLALHGERLGVTVIKHKANADPAAVAFDAIEHAKARGKDVVLLDTAGRMQNNSNLMDEMDKIRRVANPDLCVFVGDSLAGNDAVEQARKFDEIVDVGGVILTKVDVDAKGGAALSVAYTINKPLLFVGVGQNYPDLKPFDADWMVDRLFGSDEGETAEAAAAA